MKGRRHSQFKKVLIAYDGSAQSEKATDKALALAQSLDAQVLLFAVARPPEPATMVELEDAGGFNRRESAAVRPLPGDGGLLNAGAKMDSPSKKKAAVLNEHQARRLRVTCQYIDKLLGEVEGILNASLSKTAFPRYSADVDTAQHRAIEDSVGRIRLQLLRALAGHGLQRDESPISASYAIHVALGSIEIALEELEPRHMRGYGELREGAATALNQIIGELRGLVLNLDKQVRLGQQAAHRHGEEEPGRTI